MFTGSTDVEVQDVLPFGLIAVSQLGFGEGQTMLDIGCGIGRIAVQAANRYTDTITYEGLDPIKEGIGWCKKNISSQYSNFNFSHIDLKNQLYNPEGTLDPENFTLPYLDNSFDVVILSSVFTHLLPKELENYIKEI